VKNLSLILNAVLLVAVGVLYYLHFSKPTAVTPEVNEDTTEVVTPVPLPEIRSVNGPIAFINSDVLSEKYGFIKDSKAQLESYFRAKEDGLKQKEAKLRNDYQQFIQEAQGFTEQAIAEKEEQFRQRQQELMMDGQKLQEELETKQEENYKNILKRVDDYLRQLTKQKNYSYVFTYSKGMPATIVYANDSLEITNQVVTGLNQEYKAKKGK
jgi:outer membrane protein